MRSPPKRRERRSGMSRSRSKAASRNYSATDDSSDGGEDAPLVATKEPGRRTSKNEIRIVSGNSASVSKAGETSTALSQLSVSANGSSTSSLDSPLDMTDNEVYKTVIPKVDTSRRENSLAMYLNRPIEPEVNVVVQSKQDSGSETPV